MQNITLRIASQDISSWILIQKGLLQQSDWIDLLSKLSKRFALITDDNVKDLFGHTLKKKLEERGLEVHLFSVPIGEKSKTREWKERLEDQMQGAGLGRDSAIIALGGGVVTDLAGFVAATYSRGIPFVSLPTTLLGQIDASIGGKVGINTSFGKNLIGAFHYPRYVFVDPEMLSTLPPEELRSGVAEMIKYGLIASKSLFEKLENKHSWEECIDECILIKKEIVEKDPREIGLRYILNFGHTVGHAIEKVTDYTISHGEAVALGMLAESYLSCRLGYLKEEEWLRIQSLLERNQFLLRLPSGIDEKELIEVMNLDKKAHSCQSRFVLIDRIGKAVEFDGAYCSSIDPKILREMLLWLRSR